jgi:hypothetical protein
VIEKDLSPKPVELDPDVPFLELDLSRLGDALVRLALTSRQLGHTAAALTAQHYYHPASPEEKFLHDVFSLNPEEIAERWFGGTANAVRFTRALLNARP